MRNNVVTKSMVCLLLFACLAINIGGCPWDKNDDNPTGIDNNIDYHIPTKQYKVVFPYKAPETLDENIFHDSYDVITYMNYIRKKNTIKLYKALGEAVYNAKTLNAYDFVDALLSLKSESDLYTKLAPSIPMEDKSIYQGSNPNYNQTHVPAEPIFYQEDNSGNLVIIDKTEIDDIEEYQRTEGFVAYYPFNGNANDESGNGNNGAPNGVSLTTDRFGNPNSAYLFDGNDDYIVIQDSPSLDFSLTHITVEAWVKPTANSNDYKRIVGRWSGIGSNREFYLGVTPSNNFIFSLNSHGGTAIGQIGILSTTNYTPDTWYHVVGVWDGVEVRLYVNNTLEVSQPYTDGIYNGTAPLYIGTDGHDKPVSYNFPGIIDEVRIFSNALTAAEIDVLYNYR